jgi:hypothetical protein
MKTEVSERMAKRCQEELKSKGYDLDIGTIYDTKEEPAYERASVQRSSAL